MGKDSSLKFSKHKLKLQLSEVVYMGHRLTANGVSLDPVKVKAIVDTVCLNQKTKRGRKTPGLHNVPFPFFPKAC